jgi:hypothetical protein
MLSRLRFRARLRGAWSRLRRAAAELQKPPEPLASLDDLRRVERKAAESLRLATESARAIELLLHENVRLRQRLDGVSGDAR